MTQTTTAGETAARFEISYAKLPEEFYARVAPTPVAAPRLLRLNAALAEELGLDAEELARPDGVALLAGNGRFEGVHPIAMAYAGHQFGNWVPRLGDGRAVLLGEVIDREGVRRDIQLKGAGRTPFSRRGDGRAVLGPVLREYVLSEAMFALGIPTTRALAMVATGESVVRERAEPGAVLTRVAKGHIRVGTFEYFHARETSDSVRTLADYVIERRFPDLAEATNPYRALLDQVVAGQADLIARWLLVGFIHGVMNTDNMSILCETIDYGPCAFMDAYEPTKVYSSIDQHGRYAYNQQPGIGLWNLTRFAETLLPLLADDEAAGIESAQESLGAYYTHFQQSYDVGLCRKLGLADASEPNLAVASALLEAMATGRADFTLTFRRLCRLRNEASAADAAASSLFEAPNAFDAWAANWRARLHHEGRDETSRQDAMRATNPVFIPRNHQVQHAIEAAVEAQDLAPLDELIRATTHPFTDDPTLAAHAEGPEPHEIVHATFCGT